MAEILAPRIGEEGTAFEQPVVDTSVGSALASFGQFLGSMAPTTPSEASIVGAAERKFYATASRARQLRAIGQEQQAVDLLRNGYVEYAAINGAENEDINNLFQDFTGISTTMELTGSPASYADVVDDEMYQGQLFLAQQENPNGTPADWAAVARLRTHENWAANARIQNAENDKTVSWLDVERSYVAKTELFAEQLTALVKSAQEDIVITPEEAVAIRNYFRDEVGGLTKPVGATAEQWKQYQDNHVTPLNKIIEGVTSLDATFNDDMKRAISDILSKAVSQGKLPPMLLQKFNQGSAGDLDSLANLIRSQPKGPDGVQWLEQYKAVLGMDFDTLLNWVTEFEHGGTDYLDWVQTDEFSRLNPEIKRDSVLLDTRLLGSASASPEQVALDLINITEKLIAMPQDILLADDFNRTFSPAFIRGLKKVHEANPVIGDELIIRTQEALASQSASAVIAIRSAATLNGFTIDSTGPRARLVVDREAIDQHFSPSTVTIVEKYWNGDWEQAILDRGQGKDIVELPPNAIVGELADHNNLFIEINGKLQTINAHESFRTRLEDEFPKFFEEPEIEPTVTEEPEVRTRGVDFSNVNINEAMNPLFSMEGASHMVHEGANERMEALLSNQYARLQEAFGQPLTINDAIAKEGTSRERETPGSRHFHGDALDIDISGMSDADKMRLVDLAKRMGFIGFGFGRNILHLDMRPGEVVGWGYGDNYTFAGQSIDDMISHVKEVIVTARFGSNEEVQAALDRGQLQEGDIIEVDGQQYKVQRGG